MKLNYRLLEAQFIDRPNRFLTRVELNGSIIESHLPDPGRLKELLKPGARILLKKENGNNRRTRKGNHRTSRGTSQGHKGQA